MKRGEFLCFQSEPSLSGYDSTTSTGPASRQKTRILLKFTVSSVHRIEGVDTQAAAVSWRPKFEVPEDLRWPGDTFSPDVFQEWEM